MRNILEDIVAFKINEVEERKSLYPIKLLEKSIFYSTSPVSLSKYLHRPDLSGIIAEFKRQSPSKGTINEYGSVQKISIGYMQAGASALSILTDNKFFGGNNNDLTTARKYNYCPVLRKDFIIDEYQVIEAKSIGADAILLIAEILDKQKIKLLSGLAKSLGMEVLFEMHDIKEIDKVSDDITIIGINSRDLKTFDVSIDHSVNMVEQIPKGFISIAESGIDSPETLLKLKKSGFHGFLIGERFMKTSDPGASCSKFIQTLKQLQSV
jgi:indole-3-glycerol phosphate synthase